jgi:four helix bundle protein
MYDTFEQMPVWKRGMELAEQIFALTERLPKKEDYGLTSQIRRSALSVPGNIAEGFGRHHTKDNINFYYVSRGSLAETKSHLIYGLRVGYLDQAGCHSLERLIATIWQELNQLISSLSRRSQP